MIVSVTIILILLSLAILSLNVVANPDTQCISNPIIRRLSLFAKPSIVNYISTDGAFDVLSYLGHRHNFQKRQRLINTVTNIMDFAMEGKLKFKKRRDYDGYDPELSRTSTWYQNYVLNRDAYFKKSKNRIAFRLRFRMPHFAFVNFVKTARDENWFPSYENVNALGQFGVPLDILMLGCLRYLGRGWTFDDLEEATNISQVTFRKFFKDDFIVVGRETLFSRYVTAPQTEREIADCMSEFKEAGFDGAIASADATHIVWDRCPFKMKNQNSGGKEKINFIFNIQYEWYDYII
jgi:hypothetical protein